MLPVSGRLLRTALLALASAPGLACHTVGIRSPIAATGELKVGLPARAYEVVHGEQELVGLVVRFEGARPEESCFIVRNIWHQDLGLIDDLGRAYRYLPHHREPAWVGSGTVRTGVERILALEGCHLFEVPFRETRTATSPGERERRRVDREASLDPVR